VEEELGKVGNARLRVLQAEGHVADVTLGLDHVVKNQVRENHQRVLSHCDILVMKAVVDKLGVRLNQVREAEGNVTKCDNDVGSECRRIFALKNAEEEL
jgi:hypothetical protein